MSKKQIIMIISWILVVIWMLIIFWFSDMTGEVSRNKSTKTVDKLVETTIDATNKTGITNVHPSEAKKAKITKELNYPLRKMMHVLEYFILTLLLLNALYQSNVRGYKLYILAILIAIIYACTDEIHQLFVERTGQVLDVLIDSIGVFTAAFITFLLNKLLKLNKN